MPDPLYENSCSAALEEAGLHCSTAPCSTARWSWASPSPTSSH
ncbi:MULTISPECIES: hypothetical protein [Streptomyces]|nr:MULTISPECIES: hypothetical protein [Streptomyces]